MLQETSLPWTAGWDPRDEDGDAEHASAAAAPYRAGWPLHHGDVSETSLNEPPSEKVLIIAG